MNSHKKDNEKPFQKFYKDEKRKKKSSFKEDKSATKRSFEKRDSGETTTFSGKKERPFENKFKSKHSGDKRFGKGTGKTFSKSKPYFSETSSDFNGKAKFGKRRNEGDFRKEKPSESRPKKFSGKSNLRKFEEKDLSFGRKKNKENTEIQKHSEPEITFSKELENKWEQKMPTSSFKARKGRPADKFAKNHEHSPREKGFRNFFEQDESVPEKVFDAHGSKKKFGNAYLKKAATDNESEEMPLNKYIAHCDVCGRREAALLVKEGKVKVNGELITDPGHKVTARDQVALSGKKLHLQEKQIYILLNKPKGFITTTDDPKGRRTVIDIFKGQIEERIFPIGRLDRNTTGLLLITNDGDLAQKLAHPSHEIRKVYQVSLDKNLSQADLEKIQEGVVLEDGPAPVDQIAFLDTKKELGLEIHNGRNRIVRRIFESLGYTVEKLDRVMYAGLTKKQVPRGQWRFLSKQEVINLKHLDKS